MISTPPAITSGQAANFVETCAADGEISGILGNARPGDSYSIEKERTTGEHRAHLYATEALRETALFRATVCEKNEMPVKMEIDGSNPGQKSVPGPMTPLVETLLGKRPKRTQLVFRS